FKLSKSHPPSCVSVLSFSLLLSFTLRLLCSSDYAPVCGSNGESYENHCLLRKEACKLQTEVLVVSESACPVGTSLCREVTVLPVCVCRWTSPRCLLY
uniref:Kazal-like domain-containing protein n=1 Tax=Sinocyclocheilus grahami TaxID=75366 RepID=A0A672PI26_SINGR